MKRWMIGPTVLLLSLLFGSLCSAQKVVSSSTQVPASPQGRDLLGIKLRPEIALIVREIEAKTRKPIYGYFEEQPQYQLGASYVDEDGGMAVVSIDPALKEHPKKLEAVMTHELLHLRLSVNDYPSYVWSPKVRTAKGLAIDVEQGTINELRSIIEHRVFRADMIKFDLYKYIDLAGDTLAEARKHKGRMAGQTETINYVRALLEYPDQKDVAAVKQAYSANGWQRSVKDGTEIASIIDNAVIVTPADIENVFVKCVAKLYPPPSKAYAFTLSIDKTNKYFRRLILNIGRIAKK